ncbi:MAG: hypothetical protein ACRD8O_05615 [Bryobacteraceae bacterium]
MFVDSETVHAFLGLSFRHDWVVYSGISQASKEEPAMRQSKFPAGWDEEKVRRVLAYHEEQTEEDAVVEDEAGIEPSETVMNVPHDLVAKVRKLIAKRHG